MDETNKQRDTWPMVSSDDTSDPAIPRTSMYLIYDPTAHVWYVRKQGIAGNLFQHSDPGVCLMWIQAHMRNTSTP